MTAKVEGVQTPRLWWSVPGRDEELSRQLLEACLEFADVIGVPVAPWQRLVLSEWLAVDSDGRWVAAQHTLIVPRQNGKSSLLWLLMLFRLVRMRDERQVYTSHKYQVTRISFEELARFIESTPALEPFKLRISRATGKETIALPGGGWIKFLARTDNPPRGMAKVAAQYYDEAFQISVAAYEGFSYTQAAHPDPQAFFISSAGDEESELLAKFREDGRAGGSATAGLMEWSASETDDPSLEESWLRANPGIGHSLTLRRVRTEFESTPRLDSFRRERLGVWVAALKEHAIDAAAFDACLDPDAPVNPPAGHTGPISLGLDVDYDRRGTALAVAWLDGSTERVSILEFNPSSDKPVIGGLYDRLAGYQPPVTVGRFGLVSQGDAPYRLHLRPSRDVRALYDQLRWDEALGLSAEAPRPGAPQTLRQLAWPDYASACQMLRDSVAEQALRVLPSDSLGAAVRAAGVRVSDRDGTWLFERRNEVPLAPLVAAAMALWGLRAMAGETETVEENNRVAIL